VGEAGWLASSRTSWRLVAGNTGPGVYKDWPLAESVLLTVAEVGTGLPFN
jgi:hypothetical protein